MKLVTRKTRNRRYLRAARDWLEFQEKLEKRLARFRSIKRKKEWLKKNNIIVHDQSQWRDSCGTTGCVAGYVAHLDYIQGKAVFFNQFLREHPEEVSSHADYDANNFNSVWLTHAWSIEHADGTTQHDVRYFPDAPNYVVLNRKEHKLSSVKNYAMKRLGLSEGEANTLFYGQADRSSLIRQLDRLITGKDLYTSSIVE